MSIPNKSVDLEPETASAPAPLVIDPDNPPWGVGLALLTFLASVVFLVVVPGLCVLPYFSSHYPSGTPLTPQLLLTDKTLVLIFILAYIPVHVLTFAVAWAVATRLGKFSLRATLGWAWPANFGIGKSVGLGLLLLMFTLVLSLLVARIFGQQETDMERIIESSRGAALTTAFLAVFTAPLVEETVYRGILYPAFQRGMGAFAAVVAVVWLKTELSDARQRTIGMIAAVVIVAGLFAGLHVLQYWPNAAAISAVTVLSVVLTVVRARTGRLLPCFVMHLTFNGVQSALIVVSSYWGEIERLVLRRNQAGILIALFHH